MISYIFDTVIFIFILGYVNYNISCALRGVRIPTPKQN